MKLLKKDEKDKLSYKFGTKVLGEIYEDKKERSIILLILWFIFILFVTLFVRESFKYKKEEPVFIKPNVLIEKLNNGYKYDLTISNNNNNIYYNGEVNNGIDVGVKNENDMEINYRIVNGIAYDYLTGDEISYPYDDLSLKIINYLTNYDRSYIEDDLKIYEYKINYNNFDILVTLKTTYDKVSLIKYEYLGNFYIINYY